MLAIVSTLEFIVFDNILHTIDIFCCTHSSQISEGHIGWSRHNAVTMGYVQISIQSIILSSGS